MGGVHFYMKNVLLSPPRAEILSASKMQENKKVADSSLHSQEEAF